MVIVMEQAATEEQVQRVIETLVAVGYDVHRSTGVSHTVLGAVGTPSRVIDESRRLERLAADGPEPASGPGGDGKGD